MNCQETRAGVLREDLLHLLCRSEDFPLTLLLAPAGSGKSTLLSHFRSRHRVRAVAYYAIQSNDNDPQRFFRRLIECIRAQISDFDFSWFNPLESSQAPALVGERLAEALARIDGGLCLLLDDFQFIRQPSILAVIAALLEQVPSNIRLIISSRNHPGFALSRLKLEGQLLCIDQHDLRLSAAQVQQLNSHLGGPTLPENYIHNLLEMTEGWVAGVKLALLAYARAGTIALQSFSGSQPEIVDYFGHVVFKGLPSTLRDFLLCSAIFEKFNGALCDQVLQRSGSALLLEDLAERELFMLPVENQPGWFRYHALLHNFLNSRLQIEHQPLIGQLHSRSAAYYASTGEHDLALQHAQRSGDVSLFNRLLVSSCAAWIPSGQFSEILKWVEPLAEASLLANPRLLVPLIGALTLSRRFHQAHYYLDTLKALPPSSNGQSLFEPLTEAFLSLNLQLFQDDQNFRLDQDALALIAPGAHSGIRAVSLTIIAYYHLIDGRLSLAIRFASQGKALLAQSGHSFFESYADLIIALCNRYAGHSISARKEVYSDYQRTAKASPAWVNRATAMVVALYEQNQLDEAQRLCEDLMAVVNSSSATEAIATVYLTLSRLLHRRQQLLRASRLLEQLASILQLGNYARFVSQMAQEQVRQAYLSANSRALDALAQRYQLAERLAAGDWQTTRNYDECWERYGMACVYWLLARGAKVRAVRILRVLAASLRDSELKSRALTIQAQLLALNPEQQSRELQLADLRQLISQYGLSNFSRSLYDEAPSFAAELLRLNPQELADIPDKYRATYADFFNLAHPLEIAKPSLPGLLTEREKQIFSGLLSGLSNSQISAQTGSALSTTKWHLKNIYAKLNVANRTEAILSVQSRTV
jgi:LuxR family maltose regulon positive regulatory protein